MYAIDLFCGAGGFSEGILQAGFHIVFSSDKSPYVQSTYMNRHEQLGLIQDNNTHFERSDINDLQGEFILESVNRLPYFTERNINFQQGDIDAIFGGPPCQGFSIAGRRDVNDPRNMLFREYLRIIEYIQPKYIVMENVTGFMSMQINPNFESFHGINYADNELISNVVRSEIERFGYNVLEPCILDSSEYGVPQKRQRVIFLAYREDMPPINYPIPTTPNPDEKITIAEALAGISMQTTEVDYMNNSMNGRTPHFETNIPIAHHVRQHNIEEATHSEIIRERFSLFNQGESVSTLKTRLRNLKISKQLVLNFNNYPNLLRETTFNINKNENMNILRNFLSERNITLENKHHVSIYKKIIKFWGFDINSSRYMTELKKAIDTTILDTATFTELLLTARNNFNTGITENHLIHWFENNEPIEFTDIIQERFILGNRNDMTWDELWNALLTNKNTRSRLDANRPGPTMVTLPDDFIHPTLNKILNVREMARIQSFDDSFEFLGKRTTGGTKRTEEVPQFTQVGNAVPPLMAAAIANEVAKALNPIGN
ncbi:DNA (cytosine-5-)-methyltransferase [Bacillus ndiopicus]|uniref:DNA (cytosine-5-)-methyltransferase n=1 Tax=Bacillus ndiopicus TaxID=1347368 RepID=UPI0005AAE798|nr:DNA cytosine methyltransferase [Bacillus ndiopicus]